MNDHCEMAEHRAELLHKFGLEGWASRDHDIAIYTMGDEFYKSRMHRSRVRERNASKVVHV